MNLDNAVVYDIETFPNFFSLDAESLFGDSNHCWEISEYRDDRASLLHWLQELGRSQTPMIGFNNLGFDYPVLHYLMTNPRATVTDLYAKAQSIIENDGDRFGHMIWASDRYIPQIDLFKIHHFDNPAKRTSLKSLQVNMRSNSVLESPVPFGIDLSTDQIDQYIKPYNRHDTAETKQFAHHSLKAIRFRVGLIASFGDDAMNFNDTKIGAKILEQRLGEDVCYDRSSGRKKPRQTVRRQIALRDIIFPYIAFDHPEMQRVLDFMNAQVLTPDDIENPDSVIKTKGVFSDLTANVGGVTLHFGTGGVHGSVEKQRFAAGDGWLIRDIDVEGLYPNIAIVNQLAPAHLGNAFVAEYAKLPVERKKHAKGTVENASFKLAANGTYGNSNNKYSVFYDPQFTMQITINGQLLVCMLAEKLIHVPTLQIIQVNTDGITYLVHETHEPQAVEICKWWESHTCLKLEGADYSRMWIADVNSYVAEYAGGALKQKGRYWHPDVQNYADSISENSPPAWHKDLSALVITQAAVRSMVTGVDPEHYVRMHTDPFDFMLRAKVNRGSDLVLDGRTLQRVTRYYISKSGHPLHKISPPTGVAGGFKRANGVPEAVYRQVVAEIEPGVWDERIHTKNKSRYEQRDTLINAGWDVKECNDSADFSFADLNYDYYINEARKLII
jgi:hypothetical protein